MPKSKSINASHAGTFLLGDKLKINRLGFGAMRITGPGVWGDPKDPKQARATLRKAIDLGINFIDTADSYGPEVSENLIAQTLYPYPNNLIIATKGGFTRQGPDEWKPVGRPEYLIQCVEMSLRRLKLDRIDLYQFHRIDPLVPIKESLGALKMMQKQGKIRFIGLSNFTVKEIEEARKVVDVVSVQNKYNLSEKTSENVLRYCEKHKIAFIPWAPIASGDLSNPKGRLSKLAKLKNYSPTQIAIAWLLQHSPVMLPIPGTSSISHLKENIAAASIKLTDDDLDLLEK